MQDMGPDEPYGRDFYVANAEGARRSARVVVPLILELVHPESVVDVGCGVGAWLAVFRECGVMDIAGLDGKDLDPGLLQIPADRFRVADLTQPLRLDRRFDLAISLEVAEHLPPECAEGFVESLTRMAPVVMFSAAIPGQGGTHHVNERWPDYWAGLFGTRDYVALDCVRREVWDDENVEYWYAQNTLVFVASDRLDQYPRLRAEHGGANSRALSVVHPRKYRALMDWALGRYQDTGDYRAGGWR